MKTLRPPVAFLLFLVTLSAVCVASYQSGLNHAYFSSFEYGVAYVFLAVLLNISIYCLYEIVRSERQ